jgi:hypothetical protein
LHYAKTDRRRNKRVERDQPKQARSKSSCFHELASVRFGYELKRSRPRSSRQSKGNIRAVIEPIGPSGGMSADWRNSVPPTFSFAVQVALLDAENLDHWLASCCCACCSSFMQFLIGWLTESPAEAAASSLQLWPTSNLGTVSATATTNCELKIIIENEIGIRGPLLVFGSTASSKN